MKHLIPPIFIVVLSMLMPHQTGNTVSARPHPAATLNPDRSVSTSPVTVPRTTPDDVGIDAKALTRIDRVVNEGIRARAFPGCQIVVVKDGLPIYDKCFGTFTYGTSQPVTPATLYDLASLSKTTGTLLAIMKLFDEGKLKLSDRATTYLPFLRGTDKEDITVSELLFHESGLPASLPFYELVIEAKRTSSSIPVLVKHKKRRRRKIIVHHTYQYKEGWVSNHPSVDYPLQVSDSVFVNKRFHEAAMQMIATAHLYGKVYNYSDLNFILLKEIAETITGMPMDAYLDKEFYSPMNLHNIAYLPLRTHHKDEIAPTLDNIPLRNGRVQGFVHDPCAVFLGGVAGNAGLFASAGDVARVYQMLLNHGELDGHRYLSAETCTIFTTTTSASGRRALGFDKPMPTNPKKDPCCASAPMEVYGHTGYTGTCCWVDPVHRIVYVFLSNRTFPDDRINKLVKLRIRPRIQEIIYESMK